MNSLGQGRIRKMVTTLAGPVEYRLPLGEDEVAMNPLLGHRLRIESLGEIRCLACDRRTRKSFSQGHCFPCMRSLARCDSCIIKPEKCHYEAGTCREPEWGEAHCLIPHTVYLANTGAVKVGITRKGNESIRWVDQGATQALAIRTVPDRLASGQLEIRLKSHVSDKTNWRRMLSGTPDSVDLASVGEQLASALTAEGQEPLPGEPPAAAVLTEIEYPVLQYPEKVKSLDLDKLGTVEGTLQGIKGQYLLLDTGVINMRKYGGYLVALSAD